MDEITAPVRSHPESVQSHNSNKNAGRFVRSHFGTLTSRKTVNTAPSVETNYTIITDGMFVS